MEGIKSCIYIISLQLDYIFLFQKKKGINVESSESEEEGVAMAVGKVGELPPSNSSEESSSEEELEVCVHSLFS